MTIHLRALFSRFFKKKKKARLDNISERLYILIFFFNGGWGIEFEVWTTPDRVMSINKDKHLNIYFYGW